MVSFYGPPRKLALIGLVTIVAGIALLRVDWPLAQLAVLVAMFLVSLGALHIVTTTFEGVDGALAMVRAWADVAVGGLLLAWPHPTLLFVAVAVGALVLARAVIDVAITLATRREERRWPLHVVSAIVSAALAATVIARPGHTVRDTSITIAVLAMFDGAAEVVHAGMRMRAGTAPKAERDLVVGGAGSG